MKKILLLLAFSSCYFSSAQKIVMGNYQVFDQNDYSTSVRPEKDTRDMVYGFPIDFVFSAAMSSSGSAGVILKDYKIDYSKGFFRKFGSEKVGKYYPCSVLKGLCDQAKILDGLWIEITWEYQGATYKTGERMMIEHPQYVNSLPPPSEVGYQAVRDGNVKISAITIKSYSVEKTSEIDNLIYDIKSKK